jgi:hypothetical protein
MSTNPNPNLFLSIGKSVKDEYGRPVGKIVSFALTINGKFDSAFIELSDGKFTKQPIEQLTFNGADVTYNSKIKSQTNMFCDQIPFIWRKDQALKDLVEKKKIAPDLYNELHNNFDNVLTQLKKDAQVLQEDIIQSMTRCNEEARALSYGLLHLELEHEVGRINDDSYKQAFAVLQESLRRVTAERTDLEQSKTRIANVLLGDKLPIPEKTIEKAPIPIDATQKSKVFAEVVTNTPQELPEPPVVVYVKEIGKAGI